MRLLLPLLLACGDKPSPPSSTPADSGSRETGGAGDGEGGADSAAPGEELVLVHGDWQLSYLPGPGQLRLERGAEGPVMLQLADLQLAVEDSYDPNRSYDPWWPRDTTRHLSPEGAVEARLEGASLQLSIPMQEGARAELRASPGGEGAFLLELSGESDGALIGYRWAATVREDEAFYGLGEWFDQPEHRGKLRAMQLELDTDMESAYNEAHVPIPLVIGTRGWGLFVEDQHPMVFDLGVTEADRVWVEVGQGEAASGGLRIHLFGNSAPVDITAQYLALTSPPLLPAPWALGPLLWRDENTGQAQVEEDIAQLRALDLPASGIWIDRPYATGVNTFDFDTANYTDPAAMIALAHGQGLRVALWHTPYVSDDREAAVELHAEAEAAGYFPPVSAIAFNPWSLPIDFTHPEAQSWWQGLLGEYAALGIEGYKLDYGEDITVGVAGGRSAWEFHDGRTERTMHRGYAIAYHQTYAALLPPDNGLLLCRAGSYGDQAWNNVIWPGDLDADLSRHRDLREDGSLAVGGLPAAVSAAVGLGPSGFPFFGSDTGGYRHSPPSRETFIRWFQHTALSAVMQVGNSASGQPWELLEGEDLDLYRDYSRLHLRLFPYLWTMAQSLSSGGRPLLRPFGLMYPELGLHPHDVYMLGEELLVAPVVEAGATSRSLPLPPGAWVDWFSGERLEGPGEVVVEAPLEKLPLYLREGGVVPLLRPEIDTLSPVEDPVAIESFDAEPGRLWGRAAAGGLGLAALWDGSRLELNDDGDVLVATFAPGEVFHSGAALEILGLSAAPEEVLIDGLPGEEGVDWRWEAPLLVVPAFEAELLVHR